MGFLPKTVIITLCASLIMALIAVPAFGTLFGKAAQVSDEKKRGMDAIDHGDLSEVRGGLGVYIRFLSVLLKRPLVALGLVFGVIVVIIVLFTVRSTNVEFFPSIDSEFGGVVVKARGNLSLRERDALVKQVESRVLGMESIKTITTTVSAVPGRSDSEDTIGSLMMEFTDWQERPSSEIVLRNAVERASDIPGLKVESQAPQTGPSSGVDIQMQFFGPSRDALYATVDQLVHRLTQDERIQSVNDNRPLDGLEWLIDVDREAASRFNVSLNAIGSAVRMITDGVQLGSYRPNDADEEVDILIRYPFNGRDLEQIDELTVTSNGAQVPISNFISRKAQNKQGDVYRTDGRMTVNVDINLAEGARVDLMIAEIEQALTDARTEGELPNNVDFRFTGDQEEQAETMAFLGSAFLVALFVMVIILVTQFNSFYQTFLIMLAILLSTVGVMVGIILTGASFVVVMSGVGIIALAGIVVNNNIVLIDTYNVIRKQGVPAMDAALITCAQRLRPVILTTITTILGLLPMVYQLTINFFDRSVTIGAPSSQWWTALATTIAGGLLFASLLTLVFTPCMLILGERVQVFIANKRGKTVEV